MKSPVLAAGRAVLLAGPVVLAFLSGGYPAEPRNWAGLGAWSLLAVGAVFSPLPLARSIASRLAVAGLVGLAAWTLLSTLWAPVAGPAWHDGERVWLYAGALLAGVALLRGRRALRLVEPAVAAGAFVVIAYGLSERLLPSVVHLHQSTTAFGRLEQPLTYWNAMGVLAAVGIVVALRLAGDHQRRDATRVLAATVCAPLGLGLYITFSRGALFGLAAGVIALVVAAPWRAQLASLAVGLAGAVAAAVAAAPFRGVTRLAGDAGARSTDGLAVLAALMLIALVVAFVQWRRVLAGRDTPQPGPRLRLPRHASGIALGVVLLALVGFLAVGSTEHGSRQSVARGAARLTTLESNRYEYWKVAAGAFADRPLQGIGASGFAARWLRYRPFSEGAHDAHSLYIETGAELGLVGLALLAAFFAGIVLAARQAHALSPAFAAGPIAGLAVLSAHAAVDWDWELPAVTLPGLLLVAVLLVLADLRAGVARA